MSKDSSLNPPCLLNEAMDTLQSVEKQEYDAEAKSISGDDEEDSEKRIGNIQSSPNDEGLKKRLDVTKTGQNTDEDGDQKKVTESKITNDRLENGLDTATSVTQVKMESPGVIATSVSFEMTGDGVNRDDVPPLSPVQVKGSDKRGEVPNTEKATSSPHDPPAYYQYQGPPHPYMIPGYPHPYQPAPTPWGYYPGYYTPSYPPPPSQFPVPGPGSSSTSPYYVQPPPPSFSKQTNDDRMPPPSSGPTHTEHYPPGPPPYPYYHGYPPPPTLGSQPPMSPLMQQPLFHSPGASPSGYGAYYSSSLTPKGHSRHPHMQRAGASAYSYPPYFPPPSEFSKNYGSQMMSENDDPQTKRLRDSEYNFDAQSPSETERKGDKRLKSKASYKKKNGPHNDKENSGKNVKEGVDKVVSSSHGYDEDRDQHRGSCSVASTATTNETSSVNPLIVATYVKARAPSNQEDIDRRSKKNAQSRARAEVRKERIILIKMKPETERTNEEEKFLLDFDKSRDRKNNRSRNRATENKERVDFILSKPAEDRSRIENQFLEQFMDRKQRKNEGDRLRRERLKMLGLDCKKTGEDDGPKPTVPARGPLPPELLARATGKIKDGSVYPSSPGMERDPYHSFSPSRHHIHPYSPAPPPPHGYAPYHAYPPPYWPDVYSAYPTAPPPMGDEEAGRRQTQYHNSFSIYPTHKGPVATTTKHTSWTTPPRPPDEFNSHRDQPVVTTDGGKKEKGYRTGDTEQPTGALAVTTTTKKNNGFGGTTCDSLTK